LITCILKIPYIPEIIDDYSLIPFKLVIYYSKNNYINFVWLIPIVSSSFMLASTLYYKLINFDTRFKNRYRYLLRLLKENFWSSILFAIFTTVIQWFIFMIYFKFNIEMSEMIYLIIIKYALETYLLSISILAISLLINNFIYSYVIMISIVIILINSFRTSFFPFVNLYCNYNINIVDVIVISILVLLIKFIYEKKDLGGVKNEVDC
jgi:hypothetical protein